MAGALLDTNAVSDLMRDHPLLKARAAAYPGRLCTSVLRATKGEGGFHRRRGASVELFPGRRRLKVRPAGRRR